MLIKYKKEFINSDNIFSLEIENNRYIKIWCNTTGLTSHWYFENAKTADDVFEKIYLSGFKQDIFDIDEIVKNNTGYEEIPVANEIDIDVKSGQSQFGAEMNLQFLRHPSVYPD